MTVAEWQKRLADNFTVNGIIGGDLAPIFETEDHISSYVVNTFKGHNVLTDSFMGFFAQTLRTTRLFIASNGWPQAKLNYPLVLTYFLHLFRRFRACEILSQKGYPLDAYSLMRDVKDRAMALCAVAQNISTIQNVLGTLAAPVPQDQAEYWRKSLRKRKDEENKISRRLVGVDSGLTPAIQGTLKLWDDIFHLEVHGGMLSLMQEVSGFQEGRGSYIGPTQNQEAYIIYINRAAEIGWLITRLLPYLQASENAFGEQWEQRRAILDASFRHVSEEMTSIGKDIGEAFRTFVDTKYSFKQPFCYFEADGTA